MHTDNIAALHQRVHGGTDAAGPAAFDFSTNSNACGPCAITLARVAQADPTRYPDPHYTALREALAHFHGVPAQRIVLAGSASEFIFRVTALALRLGAETVTVPEHGYGDYTQAARAWGLRITTQHSPHLVWACEPSSPLGQGHSTWPESTFRPGAGERARPLVVLDCAYAPLRLSGAPSLNAAQRGQVWQLWSPNKALGLTGLRAAYALAPSGAEALVQRLDSMAPSWPIGAHGVEMLQAWVSDAVQHALAQKLDILRAWKAQQIARLSALGWGLPSDANFFCARPPHALDLDALRRHGVKLRDATSFGLPGLVRLSVQSPAAQEALVSAIGHCGAPRAAT